MGWGDPASTYTRISAPSFILFVVFKVLLLPSSIVTAHAAFCFRFSASLGVYRLLCAHPWLDVTHVPHKTFIILLLFCNCVQYEEHYGMHTICQDVTKSISTINKRHTNKFIIVMHKLVRPVRWPNTPAPTS